MNWLHLVPEVYGTRLYYHEDLAAEVLTTTELLPTLLPIDLVTVFVTRGIRVPTADFVTMGNFGFRQTCCWVFWLYTVTRILATPLLSGICLQVLFHGLGWRVEVCVWEGGG